MNMYSSNKRRLLIIDKHQFGKLIDSYKWCELLRNKYDITIVCHEHICDIPSGIKAKEVSISAPKIVRIIWFMGMALWYILKFRKERIFVVYFEGCSILKKMCPWVRMHVDIRTMAVNEEESIRQKYDNTLKTEIRYFDSVSVISDGVANLLPVSDINILPLGADKISISPKNYNDTIRLLYVGTLRGRKIDVTIKGVSIFHINNPDLRITYDIVGGGTATEEREIAELISKLHLQNEVVYHGAKPYNELQPFFDKCNVGFSFVPLTSYYDIQPPTKTFEYTQSGIFVIATPTSENKKLITKDNGILLQNDTPEAIATAIEKYWSQRFNISELGIRESLSKHNWETIVEHSLIPILENKI